MITNCSAERSFSKLKQIENRLRTSMTHGRLVNLAIMSTESDILRKIAIVSDFAVAKSRKMFGFDFRLWEFVWKLQVHARLLY